MLAKPGVAKASRQTLIILLKHGADCFRSTVTDGRGSIISPVSFLDHWCQSFTQVALNRAKLLITKNLLYWETIGAAFGSLSFLSFGPCIADDQTLLLLHMSAAIVRCLHDGGLHSLIAVGCHHGCHHAITFDLFTGLDPPESPPGGAYAKPAGGCGGMDLPLRHCVDTRHFSTCHAHVIARGVRVPMKELLHKVNSTLLQ